jgi:ribosomal-protein-alanine N-acetyltransferase
VSDTGPAVVVRLACPEDLRAVERIERRSFADPWPGEAIYEELQPDALRFPLVAERAGTAVGYLMAWRCGDELHILNLAVAPEERRRGTGSLLLEAALAAAAESGLTLVTLEVRESNVGARSFYGRHGFDSVGRRSAYYRDNGEDALIMSRPVGPPAA